MTESMLPNETLQSQLSAFVDGELPTAETELLARRLARDPDLQQEMGRYLLMGEAMRTPTHGRSVSKDFSAKIAAAIEQADAKPAAAESVSSRHSRSLSAQWLKPAAGVAIAASVALASVLAVRALQSNGDATVAQQAQPSATTQLAAEVSSSDSYVVPAVANAPSAPIPAARLTNYVVAHSEFTSPLGQRNMLMGLLSDDQTSEADTDAAAGSEQQAKSTETHKSTEK